MSSTGELAGSGPGGIGGAFSRTIGKTIESAAARIEAFWNDLGNRLLCAYRMSAFGDEALAAEFAASARRTRACPMSSM